MSTLHEQIKERIDGIENSERIPAAPLDALRAVVELHAPEFFGGVIACLACSPGMPPQILIEAPCPTITAIAEALGIGETPK